MANNNSGTPDTLEGKKLKHNPGRYSFDDYSNAPTEEIEVPDQQSGDVCTCCGKGKLYDSDSRKLLQFSATAPINVHRIKKKVLRCNTCGHEFMSHRPIQKWDPSANSAIVIQKAYGMPL